jgi:hypothetical protein
MEKEAFAAQSAGIEERRGAPNESEEKEDSTCLPKRRSGLAGGEHGKSLEAAVCDVDGIVSGIPTGTGVLGALKKKFKKELACGMVL